MTRYCARALALALAAVASSQCPAHAQDLVWEVVNPFRFYKNETAFKLHEHAFKAVRGDGDAASDPQIIRKIERCLNDPKSLDGSTRTACEALVQRYGIDARLGWAATTLGSTCYDYLTARPRRFPASCERMHAGKSVLEDYILPESHTVSISLSPARRTEAGNGECVWSVRPRAGGEWVRSGPQRCADTKSIEVPFAKDKSVSGLEVRVDAPGGLVLTEQVIVEDLLVAALGDSFASGEGNPDRPVIFSPVRGLNYQTECNRPVVAQMKAFAPPTGRDSFILPRRLMKDEQQGGQQYDYCSDEFKRAFWERSARWLSPDCHRSQYAFPMRVSLQIALEDRHRAVTLVHLACSGALVTEGLFKPLAAREHFEPTANKTKMVPSQFEQLTNLICSVDARTRGANYPVKVPLRLGKEQLVDETLSALWCPAGKRKREIDLVLLSIGGNDAGFSPLAAYTFLERASEIVPLAGLTEGQLRFGPTIATVYLTTLRARMDAVQKALNAGFGVDASRVIQASYENVEYSERGGGELCGGSGRERLGMDVHANFKFDATRVREVNRFLTQLFNGLQCVTNGEKCPPNSPPREGTKFTLVSDHQPEFLDRGICAVDPQNASADERTMVMPRVVAGSLTPWTPSTYRAYAHRMRLFRTPNDAFLTANEHRGHETNLFDTLQPPVAALFSGAFHPTAEAHSIVADHVVVHARRVLAEQQTAR